MYDIYVQDQFLKTPLGNSIEVPTLALAKAIEDEWEKDPSHDYRQKPLTSLVATALDRVADERINYIHQIIQALPNDVVLFWTTMPESLVKLQNEKWLPVIEKVNSTFELGLKPSTTLNIHELSEQEKEKVKEALYPLSIFMLVGFVHLLNLTHSFCISYLLIKGSLPSEEAWDLSHLHEHEQQRIWGQDEEALKSEKALHQEFSETVRFLNLIQSAC